MADEYETDVPVTTMIPLYYRTVPGNLTKRIIAIQRIWRKTWAIKQQSQIVELARFFVDLYARARREGIIIPSLDYEQKVAAQDYSWTMKHHRARDREIAYQARARREGIIIPSSDYEQKLAARDYSWTMKRHRAQEREIAFQARLFARRLQEQCERESAYRAR